MADHYPTGVNENLAGTLLVATPKLDTTRFARSVIWLFEHTVNGAQGCVLNKPSEVPIAHALQTPAAQDLSEQTIYVGGPVNPRGIYLVHTPEWSSRNTLFVGQYGVTSDAHMIERMSQMGEPVYWRLCVGAAGWSPGQLEQEIDTGSWLTTPARDDIMFEGNDQSQWNRALELHSQSLFSQYI